MAIGIAEYDPAWPEQFRAEASRLADLLDPWLATPVEHVGSTSVPGLAAKPVLDMMAGVHDLHSAQAVIAVLTSHGYMHAVGRAASPGRHPGMRRRTRGPRPRTHADDSHRRGERARSEDVVRRLVTTTYQVRVPDNLSTGGAVDLSS
jgi:GrpB-like predicted nucleotidyltransferase (UPF0157 family)